MVALELAASTDATQAQDQALVVSLAATAVLARAELALIKTVVIVGPRKRG